MPSDEAIQSTRDALRANPAKLRAGGKMTIDMKIMKARTWPTIEIWVKAKRQYLTLSVGDVWRYETAEARDTVLSALQNVKVSNDDSGNAPSKSL